MTVRRLIPLLVLIAACGGTVAPTTTSTTTTTTTVSSAPTSPSTTTTEAPAPTEAVVQFQFLAAGEIYANDQDVDIHAPNELGPWPVVVTIHGGGWFAGALGTMSALADDLAGRGAVVFNATYRTVTKGGSFPGTVDDVACAVAYARHRAPAFTTTPDRVVIVGHSAGAHLASLVALAPGEFGDGCPWAEDTTADALIGLAGPYNTDRLAVILGPFFGTDPRQDPGPWLRGNPLTYVADSPGIPILLIHGDADQVAPVEFSVEFEEALVDAGKPVVLELLPAAEHNAVRDPRVVAETIYEFITGQ